MSFLKAEWRKLLMANYLVDPELLQPYLPKHTELDLWEGNCYVSVVGFLFKNTKVLGLKIPFHINFEEVNLRFYVKHKHQGEWRRGVVFIKEIVPKTMITLVANTLYKEHYETWPMEHQWKAAADHLQVAYSWKHRGKTQHFSAICHPEAQAIPDNGETEFITQHFWGYTRYDEQTTFEYEVTHPRWLHYPVKSYDLNLDFSWVYGEQFAHLNLLEPHSVFLAEGSDITVEGKRKL